MPDSSQAERRWQRRARYCLEGACCDGSTSVGAGGGAHIVVAWPAARSLALADSASQAVARLMGAVYASVGRAGPEVVSGHSIVVMSITLNHACFTVCCHKV